MPILGYRRAGRILNFERHTHLRSPCLANATAKFKDSKAALKELALLDRLACNRDVAGPVKIGMPVIGSE